MTGLKAIEKLKSLNTQRKTGGQCELLSEREYNKLYDNIEKELKAFQLLFNKNILNTNNNGIISIWETKLINGITYCYEMQILLDNNRMIIPLTKEQFELLKEVVENEH